MSSHHANECSLGTAQLSIAQLAQCVFMQGTMTIVRLMMHVLTEKRSIRNVTRRQPCGAGYIDSPMTDIPGLGKLHRENMMQPEDVAEAAMLPFIISTNCVPAEIYLSNGPAVENS